MPPTTPKGPLCTRSSLVNDLQSLGLNPGDTVLVHSSLSRIGWISGGVETLVHSLLDVLTPQGTLAVPSQTRSNFNLDPSKWAHPPVPEEWWQTIRDTIPLFDAQTSRTQRMGALPETIRTWPGAVRINHAQTSFSAIGAKANFLMEVHALDSILGDKSPLARLEAVNAKVLLLGVDFDKCTCFHLAQYRANEPIADNSFVTVVDGERRWVTVSDIDPQTGDFLELGKDFVMEMETDVTKREVGGAQCYLFSLPQAVKFAEQWFLSYQTPAQ